MFNVHSTHRLNLGGSGNISFHISYFPAIGGRKEMQGTDSWQIFVGSSEVSMAHLPCHVSFVKVVGGAMSNRFASPVRLLCPQHLNVKYLKKEQSQI